LRLQLLVRKALQVLKVQLDLKDHKARVAQLFLLEQQRQDLQAVARLLRIQVQLLQQF
tara:strand:+ start:152 stop:325 length:174 start_codon:yes stop_codon:yes gene_type:complete